MTIDTVTRVPCGWLCVSRTMKTICTILSNLIAVVVTTYVKYNNISADLLVLVVYTSRTTTTETCLNILGN